MSSDDAFVVTAEQDPGQAEPFRAGTIQWLRRPGDGERDALAAGYWFVEPADMAPETEVPLHGDETVYVVRGHIRIAVDDVVHDLCTGASLSINAGARTRWTVVEPTVEFFVFS